MCANVCACAYRGHCYIFKRERRAHLLHSRGQMWRLREKVKNVASEELVMCHKVGREIVEDAVRCKMRILQNDGIVTGFCARPRKVSQALLLLGGQTFMCDKVYMIDNKTKEITPKTDIPSPRKECSACAIGCKVCTVCDLSLNLCVFM